MSSNESKGQMGVMPTIIILLVVSVGISLLIRTACTRGTAGDRIMDPPVIRTNAEATDFLAKAEALSAKILEKVASGDSISDNEKDNLREAANIFKGVIAFDPTKFGSYFAEGKIRFAIGEYQEAFNLMQQAIVLAPPPNPKPPIEVVRAVAEAHYVSSRCLFFLGRYTEAIQAADLAVTMAPSSADYMIAKAAALLEEKPKDSKVAKVNEDLAKILVVKALGQDPSHKDALRLAKFLKLR